MALPSGYTYDQWGNVVPANMHADTNSGTPGSGSGNGTGGTGDTGSSGGFGTANPWANWNWGYGPDMSWPPPPVPQQPMPTGNLGIQQQAAERMQGILPNGPQPDTNWTSTLPQIYAGLMAPYDYPPPPAAPASASQIPEPAIPPPTPPPSGTGNGSLADQYLQGWDPINALTFGVYGLDDVFPNGIPNQQMGLLGNVPSSTGMGLLGGHG